MLQALLTWLENWSGWLLLASLLVLVIAALLLPPLIGRMPEDYFVHQRRRRIGDTDRHPLVALLFEALRNLVGAALVCAGLVMLFTPGQGLLTLFAGLMLMNYPGKFALERWLVSRAGILGALNWIRRRRGRPPLQAPPRRATAPDQ